MFAFFAELIDLACDEIEVDLAEIHEVEIDQGFGYIWSVLFPQRSQEVFFRVVGSHPFAYHVNEYE